MAFGLRKTVFTNYTQDLIDAKDEALARASYAFEAIEEAIAELKEAAADHDDIALSAYVEANRLLKLQEGAADDAMNLTEVADALSVELGL